MNIEQEIRYRLEEEGIEMSEQEIQRTKENLLNALYANGYWDILDQTIQNTFDERKNV